MRASNELGEASAIRCHLQTPQNEVKWDDFQRLPIEKQKKEDDSDVVTAMNRGVASSLSSLSKSICKTEMGITRIRGAQKTVASFQHLEQAQTSRTIPISPKAQTSWTTPISPKAKPVDSHMVGWLYLGHMEIPTMIAWTTYSKVHQKSSARKVTPSKYCFGLRQLQPWENTKRCSETLTMARETESSSDQLPRGCP